MSVNVSYKNRIGYCTLTEKYKDEEPRKYKLWFCHANCLCAMMYFYDKEEDGKKTPMAQLHLFFGDNKHAKKCIDDNLFENYSNFHFYAKEMDGDLWKLVKDMTAHGIKVVIE